MEYPPGRYYLSTTPRESQSVQEPLCDASGLGESMTRHAPLQLDQVIKWAKNSETVGFRGSLVCGAVAGWGHTPAGAEHVSDVTDCHVTSVHIELPTITFSDRTNPAPVTVSVAPPEVGLLPGEIPWMEAPAAPSPSANPMPLPDVRA